MHTKPISNAITTLSLILAFLCSIGTTSAAPKQHQYLPASEIKSIKIMAKDHQVLVRTWVGKHQHGAMVILPTTGTDADAPGLISYLRKNLNTKGWASISVTPPEQHQRPNFATSVNEVNKAGKNQISQTSNESMPKFSDEEVTAQFKRQQNFITDTLSQLDPIGTPYPGNRVLISMGQSAGTLITLLAEQKVPLPDILVIINPYVASEKDNDLLAQRLSQLAIPVLDIHSPDAHYLANANSNARRQLAMQHRPYRYNLQIMELNLTTYPAWQNCLTLIESFARRIIKQG